MTKLRNLKKLEIVALVGLMLPAIAVAEGAKPQLQTARFRIQIGTESGDNVVLSGYCEAITSVDGWGQDAYWNINPRGGGYPFEPTDVYPGTYTICLDLVGDDETVYWSEGKEQKACLSYLYHMIGCRKVVGGGRPKEVYSDYWSFGIYWYYDVNGDDIDDRVGLIVETDHDSPNAHEEWEYDSGTETSTVHLTNLPYTLVWYKYVERSIGKSSVRTVQEWQFQEILRSDIDNPTPTLTFTVTIEKLP